MLAWLKFGSQTLGYEDSFEMINVDYQLCRH